MYRMGTFRFIRDFTRFLFEDLGVFGSLRDPLSLSKVGIIFLADPFAPSSDPDIPTPSREDLLPHVHGSVRGQLAAGTLNAKHAENEWVGARRLWDEGHKRDAERRREQQQAQAVYDIPDHPEIQPEPKDLAEADERPPTDEELLRFMSAKTKQTWGRSDLTPQDRARIWQGNKKLWRAAQTQKTNADKDKSMATRHRSRGLEPPSTMPSTNQSAQQHAMPSQTKPGQSTGPGSNSFRAALAFSASTAVWSLAVNVLNQKYGTSIPDWTIVIAAYAAAGFWLYWAWHTDFVQRRRTLAYTYPRMALALMVLTGMIVGGGAGAFLWWTIQREQRARQSKEQHAAEALPQSTGPTILPTPAVTPAVQLNTSRSPSPIQSPILSPIASPSVSAAGPIGEIVDERQRRLTEEQKSQLVKILTPHKETGASGGTSVRIRFLKHDREAAQFAGDFRDVFKAVGWHHGFEPMDYHNQVPDGLSIAVKWNDLTPATAHILADALKQMGFKVKMINTNIALREEQIALIIGVNVR